MNVSATVAFFSVTTNTPAYTAPMVSVARVEQACLPALWKEAALSPCGPQRPQGQGRAFGGDLGGYFVFPVLILYRTISSSFPLSTVGISPVCVWWGHR